MFIIPEQVVMWGGGKVNFETKWVCPILESEEYAFFEEYLCADTYNCMSGYVNNWGVVKMWDSCVGLTVGDYVIYDGLIYKFIGTDSTSTPGLSPLNWELAQRFTDSGLNDLWNKHLMMVLAAKIYMAAIPAATYQVSAVGATALMDTNDGLRGTSKAELSMLMDSLGQRFYNKVQFMINYIKKNKDTLICMDECGCGCTSSTGVRNRLKTSTRIHFL